MALSCGKRRIDLRLRTVSVLALLLGSPAPVAAQLTQIVVDHTEDVDGGRAFGPAGPYERLIGRALFEFDPHNRYNARIVDLPLAERNEGGKVPAWSEISVLKPKDPREGNGTAVIDVVNRGTPVAFFLNRRVFRPPVHSVSEWNLGDGFLLEHGYTVVSLGWQWDVLPNALFGDRAVLRMHAPVLPDSITGMVRTDWTITPRDSGLRRLPLEHRLGSFVSAGYSLADDGFPALLTVRERPSAARKVVPRHLWRLHRADDDAVLTDSAGLYLQDGFTQGSIYELTFRARGTRLVGAGLLALRDLASHLKYDAGSPVRARRTIAVGYSQTGRLLRHYVYEGLNTDHRGRKALDGIFAYVAGAGRAASTIVSPSRPGTGTCCRRSTTRLISFPTAAVSRSIR